MTLGSLQAAFLSLLPAFPLLAASLIPPLSSDTYLLELWGLDSSFPLFWSLRLAPQTSPFPSEDGCSHVEAQHVTCSSVLIPWCRHRHLQSPTCPQWTCGLGEGLLCCWTV